jgi:hypothetical protein
MARYEARIESGLFVLARIADWWFDNLIWAKDNNKALSIFLGKK